MECVGEERVYTTDVSYLSRGHEGQAIVLAVNRLLRPAIYSSHTTVPSSS